MPITALSVKPRNQVAATKLSGGAYRCRGPLTEALDHARRNARRRRGTRRLSQPLVRLWVAPADSSGLRNRRTLAG